MEKVGLQWHKITSTHGKCSVNSILCVRCYSIPPFDRREPFHRSLSQILAVQQPSQSRCRDYAHRITGSDEFTLIVFSLIFVGKKKEGGREIILYRRLSS